MAKFKRVMISIPESEFEFLKALGHSKFIQKQLAEHRKIVRFKSRYTGEVKPLEDWLAMLIDPEQLDLIPVVKNSEGEWVVL